MGGNIAGMRIIQRNIKQGAATRSAAIQPGGGAGSLSGSMRGTLRQLAQSDARYYRELSNIVGSTRKPRRIRGR